MKGDRYYPLESKARQILCGFGIDPYCGCANLVIARNWCHSRAYAERVLLLLKGANNRDDAIKSLRTAALEFKACKFPDLTAEQQVLLEREKMIETNEQIDD